MLGGRSGGLVATDEPVRSLTEPIEPVAELFCELADATVQLLRDSVDPFAPTFCAVLDPPGQLLEPIGRICDDRSGCQSGELRPKLGGDTCKGLTVRPLLQLERERRNSLVERDQASSLLSAPSRRDATASAWSASLRSKLFRSRDSRPASESTALVRSASRAPVAAASSARTVSSPASDA